MRWIHLILTVFITVKGFAADARDETTGPRTDQGKPVRLTPVPLEATPAQIQAMLDRRLNLYFKPGTYKIGTLQIKNGRNSLIWGAGRLTTNLLGAIRIREGRNLVLGNFSVTNNNTAKGAAVIEVEGRSAANMTILNTLVSANSEGVAIRVKAPGRFILQGCNPKWSDIGISIEHPAARVHIFGGNLQYNRVHIQQVQGHLDARAFGMQVAKGDADIILHSPSPAGYHIIEGIRTEGNNSAHPKEALLKVPPTREAVNVVLRANTLGNMVRYADYSANGRLFLLENVGYGGAEDKHSVGITTDESTAANIVSFGNKYGLSYDEAPGPFVVGGATSVRSMGDLWMLPNKTDYSKSFNEPITQAAMKTAGKTVPANIRFPTPQEADAIEVPAIPGAQVATFPRIANLGELMLNVADFGARPGDGKDDREAIQRALNAAEKGGISEPVYFPAGRYELSAPLFLDHLAGGGFWGAGADKSVLVSTSGKGVITSDGAGYAKFVDIGFENKPGVETKTTDFDWINNLSADLKRGRTGAALQANMFYRCRFENGGLGITVGKNRMGDGFMFVDCMFKNIKAARGEGAAYVSANFNALTNPLAHCLFENVDCAVDNQKGSFNFYGNRLVGIRTAALKFYAIVGNGFAIVNNQMDSSPVPFITTGHSSAKAQLLVDRLRLDPAPQKLHASSYALGGSVLVLNSSLPNRTITNGGGIGDNSLIVLKTEAAEIAVSGRAHGYFTGSKGK